MWCTSIPLRFSVTVIGILDGRYIFDCEQSPVHFRPHAVIMHPLARNQELSTELDETDHNLYFAQAAGGCVCPTGLCSRCVLDRLDRVSGI